MFENYNEKQERNEKTLFPLGEMTALNLPDELDKKMFCLAYIIRQLTLNGRKVVLLCGEIPLETARKWIDDVECRRNDVIIREAFRGEPLKETVSSAILSATQIREEGKLNAVSIVTDLDISCEDDKYNRDIVSALKKENLSFAYTATGNYDDKVSCESIQMNFHTKTLSVKKRENILSDVAVSIEEIFWLSPSREIKDLSLELKLIDKNADRKKYCILQDEECSFQV